MTLFVDMDDVLADTYGKHLELYNMEHKKTMTMMLIESGEFWENVPLEDGDSLIFVAPIGGG